MLNPRAGMSSGFPKNDYELGGELSPHPDHFPPRNLFPLSTPGPSPDPKRAGA